MASLEISADGTFKLLHWPKGDLSGTWQDDFESSRTCNLKLSANSETYTESGHRVFGEPGHFSIGLYMSDPDEGAVVFDK